jgi:hypothetical protein
VPVCHGAWTWPAFYGVLVWLVHRAFHYTRWAAISWDVAMTGLPIVHPVARGCT